MEIAYVLYPDLTALDLVGPYEVISRWPETRVHFLARSLDPVRCDALTARFGRARRALRGRRG